MIKDKKATEHQILVNLLSFTQTPENFEKLGKTVWKILNRKESQRCYLEYKGQKLYCQEVVIHGT